MEGEETTWMFHDGMYDEEEDGDDEETARDKE
jgi:hypothetical protein